MEANSIFLSVIIPTTNPNRLFFLEEALNSLKEQDLGSHLFEVVVVTNYDLVLNNSYNFKLTIIKTDKINLGAKLVIGEENSISNILLFLEDDDTFHPKKLSTVYTLFEKHNTLSYFKNGLNLIFNTGENIYVPAFKNVEKNLYFQPNLDFFSNTSLPDIEKLYAVLSSITIKKNLIERISMCLSKVNFNSDLALLLSALDFNSVIMTDSAKLTNYRIHNGGSRTFEPDMRQFTTKTINFLKDEIDTSQELFGCLKNERTIGLLHEIMVKQELELLRWQSIDFRAFMQALTKYLKITKLKRYNLRFIIITILFYCFPKKMRNLYKHNIQEGFYAMSIDK